MNNTVSHILRGIPSSQGLVMGNAFIYDIDSMIISHIEIKVEDIENEKARFSSAINHLKTENQKIVDELNKQDKKLSELFESIMLIAEDPIIQTQILELINQRFSAESAVIQEFEIHRQLILKSKDQYLKERATELENVRNRLIQILKNINKEIIIPENSIIFANSLTTTDLFKLKEQNVKGIVTEQGGITAHSSILSRNFGIAEVISVKDLLYQIKTNDKVILDAFTGNIFINPTEEQINSFHIKINEIEIRHNQLLKLRNEISKTKDNRKIGLLANLDFIDEIHNEKSELFSADGIGLVRSENIIERYGYIPDEETQSKWYLTISEKFEGKNCVIRVFDFGSDKFSQGLIEPEKNPALGFRGIRFLLARKDIFKTQIRAILKASNGGNLKIMLPMISKLSELEKSKKLIEVCKLELDRENIDYDKNIKIGIMIETPAAVLISNELASMCDFFSIGTNDLTQYVTAADRTNGLLSRIYDSFHPSVLKLIKMTIDNANLHNISVSVCGELAGHPLATSLLIGLGVKELSVPQSTLLETKYRILNSNYLEAQVLAECVLNCSSAKQVLKLIDN